jgi:hypothetical protein
MSGPEHVEHTTPGRTAHLTGRAAVAVVIAALLLGGALGAGSILLSRPSGEQSVSVSVAWIAAVTDMDAEKLASLYAPDAVWDDAALGDHFTGGPVAAHGGWDPVFGLPGIGFKDVRLVTHGEDGFTVIWTAFGPSSPVTSTPFEAKGVSVLEVQGAQISHETVYYDTGALQ